MWGSQPGCGVELRTLPPIRPSAFASAALAVRCAVGRGRSRPASPTSPPPEPPAVPATTTIDRGDHHRPAPASEQAPPPDLARGDRSLRGARAARARRGGSSSQPCCLSKSSAIRGGDHGTRRDDGRAPKADRGPAPQRLRELYPELELVARRGAEPVVRGRRRRPRRAARPRPRRPRPGRRRRPRRRWRRRSAPAGRRARALRHRDGRARRPPRSTSPAPAPRPTPARGAAGGRAGRRRSRPTSAAATSRVNAIAVPLGGEGALLDPHGGRADIEARAAARPPSRLLRATTRPGRSAPPATPPGSASRSSRRPSGCCARPTSARSPTSAAAPSWRASPPNRAGRAGLALLAEWGLVELRPGGAELAAGGGRAARRRALARGGAARRGGAGRRARPGRAARRSWRRRGPCGPREGFELARGRDPVELVAGPCPRRRVARRLPARVALGRARDRRRRPARGRRPGGPGARPRPRAPPAAPPSTARAAGRDAEQLAVGARRGAAICLGRGDGVARARRRAVAGGADARRPRRLHDPARRRQRGALRLPQPRRPHRRRRGRGGREPAPARGGARARARRGSRSACQVHGAEIAVHDGAAGPEPVRRARQPAARGRRPRRHRARPGAARLRRRLPAGRPRSARAAWRSCTAAGGRWRPGSSPRARRRSAPPKPRSGPGSAPAATRSATRCWARSSGLGEGVADGRMLDLAEVARRLLARGRGRARSRRPASAPPARPELFFSHRRDGGITGRQAGLAWLDPIEFPTGEMALPRRRLMVEPIHGIDPAGRGQPRPRSQAEAGEGVEVLVACKYVPLEEMGALAAAGVTLVGENRQQDLAAKHERFGDDFTWDFIGNLQSRKVKQIAAAGAADPLGRHRLGPRPARAPRHARDRGPDRGQRRRRGGQGRRRAGRARRVHRPLPGQGRRPDDDAALRRGSRGLAARTSPASPSSPPSTGWRGSRWAPRRIGAVAVEEGATIIRLGTTLFAVSARSGAGGRSALIWAKFGRGLGRPRPKSPLHMAFRDTWHRALVYFGLAEDHDYGPEYEDEFDAEPRRGTFEARREPRVATATKAPRSAACRPRAAPAATKSTTSSPTTSRSPPAAPAPCARSTTAATSRSTW